MSAPPKTVLEVSRQEEAAIREAVRAADPSKLGPGRVLAAPEHAGELAAVLADPAVSDPIYDLPRPLTEDTVRGWIEAWREKRERGEGLLILTLDPVGEIAGYLQISVWPDRSAAEVAGALRADRQSAGEGGSGATRSFGWTFDTLGVRMMCLTAALDNVRSAKLIDAAEFVRMGERDAVRPDGTTRRSLYWEMTREQWRERWGGGR